MASGRLFLPGWMPARDSNGDPIPNVSVSFYENETDDLASVYADDALTIPLTNPVAANSSGRFPQIYASDAITYSASVDAPYGPAGQPFTFDGLQASQAADIAAANLAQGSAEDAETALQATLDAIETATQVGGGAAALAGALAGATAGTAAANVVVAGKADVDLQNANLPSGGWLKSATQNLLRRQANGFLEPAVPIQRDTSGQFIDFGSFLMTGLRYLVSPGSLKSQIFMVNDVLGDNATFQGGTGVYVKSQSNAAEVVGTKGVLYCFTADVAPKNDRNNYPFDDATPYVVSNTGTGRATEFFYAGRNPGLAYDSASLLGSDGNHYYGLQLAGTVDYPVELGNGSGVACTYLAGMRGSQNTVFIAAWNAARTVTIPHFAVDASDRSVIDGKVVKPSTAYTPTVTPGSGAYGGSAIASGRTSKINGIVRDVVLVTLPASLGTGAGGIRVSLSETPGSGAYGVARGMNTGLNTSSQGAVLASTPTVLFNRYDGADINAASSSFIFTIEYEAA